MLTRTLLTITLITLSFQALGTVIYTWVDENGKTHYSQQPPEKGNVTKLYSEDIEQGPIGFVAPKMKKETSELTQEEKDAQTIKLQDKAQADTLCKSAKHKLNLLMTYDRLTRKDPQSGEEVVLNEKDKQTEIAQQKERIRLFCEE